MFNYIKNTSLPILFCFSVLISANEVNVEVNMESILEVGRENQTLSANSQDKIDQTERQTDKNKELAAWILFAPAALMMDGNAESASQLASVKGQLEAVSDAMKVNDCVN